MRDQFTALDTNKKDNNILWTIKPKYESTFSDFQLYNNILVTCVIILNSSCKNNLLT